MLNGMLLVNKPSGMTSHDVVQVIRRKLTLRRIGHTGTLDPMAEGLLILLIGPATAFQQMFQAHDKTYEALLQCGTQTDTGDALGAPIRTVAVPPLDRGRVAEVLTSLQGRLTQTPPSYSAVKVHGRPAYWWARRHEPVTLAPRVVQLFEVSLVDCASTTITFRVHCSSGTYVRTLGETIAGRLGTVGHLTRLERLRVGAWRLEDAKQLRWLAEASAEAVAREVRPLPEAPDRRRER